MRIIDRYVQLEPISSKRRKDLKASVRKEAEALMERLPPSRELTKLREKYGKTQVLSKRELKVLHELARKSEAA